MCRQATMGAGSGDLHAYAYQHVLVSSAEALAQRALPSS